MEDQENKYLTLEQTSAYTGYTPSTLYKLTSQKLVPHYKPAGGKIFFLKAELDAWIKAGRVSSTDELQRVAIKRPRRT